MSEIPDNKTLIKWNCNRQWYHAVCVCVRWHKIHKIFHGQLMNCYRNPNTHKCVPGDNGGMWGHNATKSLITSGGPFDMIPILEILVLSTSQHSWFALLDWTLLLSISSQYLLGDKRHDSTRWSESGLYKTQSILWWPAIINKSHWLRFFNFNYTWKSSHTKKLL